MAEAEKPLTGAQKIAVLLISLGVDVTANILKSLPPDSVEQLTQEMAAMGKISDDMRKAVIEDLYPKITNKEVSSRGGLGFVRRVLKESVPRERAEALMSRLGKPGGDPFDSLRRMESSQLLNMIQREQPQTIALILSYLDTDQASMILSALPGERQAAIAMKIATLDKAAPDVLEKVEGVIEKQLSAQGSGTIEARGGVKLVAELLNRVDRATEKVIMESIEKNDAEMSDAIKKLMFVFEDINLVEDRSMQQVLREVDTKELALALKAASDTLKEKVYRNMSERAAQMIQEEMEFMGPVRLKDVEEAQQRIVGIVRRLEDEGTIVIGGRGGGGDEIIV